MENISQQILDPSRGQKEKPPVEQRPGIIEAILFVAGDAVDKGEIAKAMNLTLPELDEALTTLESSYNFNLRGIRLLRFGSHVQLATRPDYATYVEHLLQPVQKQSLSQAIMETLAVIAYKQPVTKGEIEQIRGVKCDYSIQSLSAKGLIEEAGRKETLGRPILYATTDAFLRHFGIASLDDLPEIDFSQLTQKLNSEGETASEDPLADEMQNETETTAPAPIPPQAEPSMEETDVSASSDSHDSGESVQDVLLDSDDEANFDGAGGIEFPLD